MKVIVIRHLKVKHKWKKRCSSAEFDKECRLYDRASIEARKSTLEFIPERVYVSTLNRSLQSARVLFGERDFCRSNLINEVPLRSAFDTHLKLPLCFWNISGRLQWLCNNKRQPESRRETIDRANSFIREMTECDVDSAIVTHGFFMHTLISQMKRLGFKSDKTGIHYSNGKMIVLISRST